jgi:hypothetical protein
VKAIRVHPPSGCRKLCREAVVMPEIGMYESGFSTRCACAFRKEGERVRKKYGVIERERELTCMFSA